MTLWVGRIYHGSTIPKNDASERLTPTATTSTYLFTQQTTDATCKRKPAAVCLFVAFTWLGQQPQCLPPSWKTGLSLWYRQEPTSFSATLKSFWHPRFTQLKRNKQTEEVHDKIGRATESTSSMYSRRGATPREGRPQRSGGRVPTGMKGGAKERVIHEESYHGSYRPRSTKRLAQYTCPAPPGRASSHVYAHHNINRMQHTHHLRT